MLTVDQCVQQLNNIHDVVIKIECNYTDIKAAKIDLYTKLKKIHQDAYKSNQRLIFVLTADLYNSDSGCGSVLQAIQVIVQDIDISNFFVCLVTTNPDIDREYQYVQKNISTDNVNFQIFKCVGNFKKIAVEHTAIEGKIQSLKNIDLDRLSEKQKHLLFSDQVFCLIPWMGINIHVDSKVYPCCETLENHNIGNIKTESIAEIWNSSKMKSIRQSMLNGKSVEGCQGCYLKESLKQNSMRTNTNRDFADAVSTVDLTQSDGTLPAINIKYWDIRHSNLCNLACRMCGPDLSTSWYQVHNSLNPNKKIKIPLITVGNQKDEVYNQIANGIDQIETIYFAGGEPSMIDSFYKILELLIKQNRTNVQLKYNMNLTRLTYKNKSLLDLWKKFDQVVVGASLDAELGRGEYIRPGAVWQTIVDNRLQIANQCPHVDFFISATTGLINALHVPDFHQSWVKHGYIKAEDFNIQLLLSPSHLSVLNAPDVLKQKIIDRYTAHLAWLTPLDKYGRAIQSFKSIIELCHQPGSYNPEKFWTEVNKLDQYYTTDLMTAFPELQNVGL
jgi:radical SAM protein with 4Fe4S-binding SPASM domain